MPVVSLYPYVGISFLVVCYTLLRSGFTNRVRQDAEPEPTGMYLRRVCKIQFWQGSVVNTALLGDAYNG